ncbi:MAG TPA: NUDIX hydrolase [Nocardioidaceae bacterium]|nr:NUDIX hydrolase [Nocardioidaceae bacterium]
MTGTGARLHADALRVLRDWTANDPGQEQLRQRYVSHLEDHADGVLRGCFPDHLTASSLVVSADGAQVLLTLHAKAGAWFQTGGHCEATDVTLAGAALREATEESGIDRLALDPEPVQLDCHEVGFCDPRGPVHHLDVRFLAVASPGAVQTVSAESLDVRWWPADALPTDEPSLRELVRLARARLGEVVGGHRGGALG